MEYSTGGDVIKPQFVVEKIYELTKGDAIIATEVGQNQMWAAQFYKYDKPATGSLPEGSVPWDTAFRQLWELNWRILKNW